jgi:hypothetical protein
MKNPQRYKDTNRKVTRRMKYNENGTWFLGT